MKSPLFVRLILGLLAFSGASVVPAQVFISEFLASNTKTITDGDGDYSDWIELHNAGPEAENLEGWHLTDSASNPVKWRFPSVSIPPGGYLLVFASGKNRAAAGAALHLNFSLDADGEYLGLIAPDGGTIASEFAPYPEQSPDISYGLFGAQNYFFPAPTPGRANTGGFLGYAADTKFNHDRGFYDAPFLLTITTATPGAVIRYTTNGTAPSLTNGAVYSGPISIPGTTTVRAAAFKDGLRPSNVDTQTYLFLNDVIRQSPDRQPPPGWPASWGGNTVDYGMDPEVVNDPLYRDTIQSDLKSIPTFSIVMDLRDLFDPARGIYANPGQDGRTWERPASVELIHPDGTEGFQINAGIRIRGGFSRSTNNPKHAFRLFFREEYGDPKLRYPLFGDAGANEFDNLDLRTFQNYSWSFQGDSRGVFLRDQFSRDTQLAMGQPTARGDFYHLYINGQYWGLYNTEERPEASYGATYFGGNKEEYDVIKVEAGPYTINATDGSMAAWTRLYNLAKAGFASNASYFRVQGRNPDGTLNPDYENLIDAPNLIDYMLVILYGGNLDAPISNFLGNSSPNNWYGLRNRAGTDGFRFITHDSEHTLLNLNEDRTGPFSAGDSSVLKSNPQYVWQKLQENPEFRLQVADHVHRHFFNNGVLTAESARARFLQRKEEIDRAVVGESARWGDAKREAPFTRNREWVSAINTVLNYLSRRSAIVLGQLREDGLYPDAAAPVFAQHGGRIPKDFTLSMTAPAGVIYYTRDGSDPRALGGAVAPNALVYQSPISFPESAVVKARALAGGQWSALNEAAFTVIQTFTELLITEIMYHPLATDESHGDDFEFIELKNAASATLDLSGVRFTNGIQFTFPSGTAVEPGGFIVLASNPVQFQKRYPGVTVHGAYSGRLANGGETLALVHAAGAPIASLTYDDAPPWPPAADGIGFSLVPVNPNFHPNPSDPLQWRSSAQTGGSPGKDDPSSSPSIVWINEILTHTDLPQKDAIELFNPTDAAINIGNWLLTDDRMVPNKFRIPAGTALPARGFLTFTEDDFNAVPGAPASFNLNSHGEQVFLYAADAAGNLTGYSDGFSFGAAENGVSFGRFVLPDGAVDYPAQTAVTLGGPNAGPRSGPIVINEIHYHPRPGEEEFVELFNFSPASVKLFDPAAPTNTWRLNGLGFAFPANVEIPPGGLALVVSSDPASFRTRHSVGATVPIFGPFSGNLQDTGERLQLLKPDSPDVQPDGTVTVPYVVVDEVRYRHLPPWPANASGSGSSLERLAPAAYGNDPASWRASVGPASPGLPNDGNKRPIVDAGPAQTLESALFPASASLTATATDDGLPNPPRQLTALWSQVEGPGTVVFQNPNSLTTAALFPGVGSYVLRVAVTDGELSAKDEVTVSIGRPSSAFTLVPAGSVWKYLDNGSNQGSAWRAREFNDAAWASGPAQLGYGDGDEGKVVGFGPNSGSKFITTYFRRTFDVANPRSITDLTLELIRDDGAIVYLNGTEVMRSNMPLGDVTSSTAASSVVGGGDESLFYTSKIDASLLREGANTLAVEVHQSGGTSSDLSFDLKLSGLRFPSNQPPVVQAGPDLTATSSEAILLEGSYQDDGLPIPPGIATLAWTKVNGPGEVRFADHTAARTTASFSAAGDYFLRLSVHDGQFTGQDELSVRVEGSSPFDAWRAAYFNARELLDASIGGELADPDLDGHNNGQEFQAGTDPRNAKSVLQLSALRLQEGAVRIRFEAAANRAYLLQYRENLTSGDWVPWIQVPSEATNRMIELTDPPAPGGGSRYYRVTLPAPPAR